VIDACGSDRRGIRRRLQVLGEQVHGEAVFGSPWLKDHELAYPTVQSS
jgi:hypothetical protein